MRGNTKRKIAMTENKAIRLNSALAEIYELMETGSVISISSDNGIHFMHTQDLLAYAKYIEGELMIVKGWSPEYPYLYEYTDSKGNIAFAISKTRDPELDRLLEHYEQK